MEVTFTSAGYFSQGRWITPQSLAAERMAGIPQQRYELIEHTAIPVFRQGALEGYRDNPTSAGVFTEDQVRLIMTDSEQQAELTVRMEIRSVS